jgi:hypothetical protein
MEEQVILFLYTLINKEKRHQDGAAWRKVQNDEKCS